MMEFFIGIFYLPDFLMIGCSRFSNRFSGLLYSTEVNRAEEDQLCWIPARGGIFKVKSYYQALTTGHSPYMPCRVVLHV